MTPLRHPARLFAVVLAAAACGGDSTSPPPSTPNQRPVPTGLIPAQELAVGETFAVDAAAYFTDPDGDALAFETESSDRGVATVTLGGSSVTVMAVAPGTTRITIRARDPGGLQARQVFDILVAAPRTEDHAALEVVYDALGGPGWINHTNWLSGRPLADWHGVTVDSEGRVSGLDLEFNGLTGALPPAVGDLERLASLDLSRNALTGPLPPELGHLSGLHALDLSDNRLDGAIPSQIGDFSSLVWLKLNGNGLTGPIPPQIGRLASLHELDLSDNELTGPTPPELGKLEQLRVLLLFGNALAGPLPAELGHLRLLWTLNLSGNAALSGPLPLEMTSLRQLDDLHLGGSALCAPAAAAFTEWLGGIRRTRVATCGGEGEVVLGQAVQSARFPVPLIAGDSALLRVFLTVAEGPSVAFPAVRARFYVEDAEVYVADIPGQANLVPTTVDEGNLASSANAVIPGRVVRPGLEVVVETDPEGTLDPALGLTRRIPETGRRAVRVRTMPEFHLTVIPFVLDSNPDRSIVALVNELTPEHELLWDTRTLLPIGDFKVTAHEPVTTSSNNQSTLLAETYAIRVAEGGTGHYMGTMTGSDGGGLAYLGDFSSFSSPRADIIAHELGHNMSLSHAPCSATGVDPWYPEPGGRIAAWGYDFRDGGALVPPDTPDLMGYCDPHWIGNYHFRNALRFRLATEGDGADAADAGRAADSRTLLIWGGVDATGAPYLEPAFVLDAPPALPSSAGPYLIRGTTTEGEELFALHFDMPRVADATDDASSFAYALPVRPGWVGTLARLTLSGPGGSVTLDADGGAPVAIARDPATARVRAILRNLRPGAVADALSLDPGLDMLVSRGIPDHEAWHR